MYTAVDDEDDDDDDDDDDDAKDDACTPVDWWPSDIDFESKGVG